MKKKTNQNNTTEIVEYQEDSEVLDDDTFLATGTMEITNNKMVENKIT